MQTLTIRAASWESAVRLYEALLGFRAELVDAEDGRHYVGIEVEGSWELVNVLRAIERHVTQRNSSPTRIEAFGRDYTLQPEPGVHGDQ